MYFFRQKICQIRRRFFNFCMNLTICQQNIKKEYNLKFDLNGKKTFDTVGCKKCNNTGYLGRIGIFEILVINDELRTLIVDNKSTIEIRKSALKSGYVPLIVDGINKVLNGTTNMNELNNKLALY